MSPKNGPPERWLDYSAMGQKIPGTRFICMKVPLKEYLMRELGDHEKFSCGTAMEEFSRMGHNLGLVIDLSYSSRYYDPQDFESRNVSYKKIFVPGQVIPESRIVNEFSDVVAKFERENQHNDDLIAVHCTHGINRTGYMICRHLIDKKRFHPKEAVDAFNMARGHNIERRVYLDDLLRPPGSRPLPIDEPWRQERARHPRRSRNSDNYYEKPVPLWRDRASLYSKDSRLKFFERSFSHEQRMDNRRLELHNPYDWPLQHGMYGSSANRWRGLPYSRPFAGRGTRGRGRRGWGYY